MELGPPRIRRPRPVGDAPLDALLERVEDLAKGWLIALLEQAPLDDAPAILAGELSQHGPQVCEAIVRALVSDDDLRSLDARGESHALAARAGELVGAHDVRSTARAVDVLQSVIWTAVRQELAYPQPDQVSELAERLAHVVELVRVAAFERSVGTQPGIVEPSGAVGREEEQVAGSGGVGGASEGAGGSEVAAASETAAPEVGAGPPTVAAAEASAAAESAPERGADADATEVHTAADAPDTAALWLSALEDEVARAAGSGAQLSLLLAELDDANRVMAAEGEREAGATFGRFAQAVRGAVRRHDILACETDTRAWIIARDTGRDGAQALGSRVAHAVTDTGPWRGVPLRVSVGLAVFGEDGRDAANLVDVAEETMYAAAASGIGIVRAATPSAPANGA